MNDVEIVKEFLIESYENLDRLDRELVELEQHGLERDVCSGLNPPHIRRACCTAAKTGDDVNVTALRLMKAVNQAKLALWIALIVR